MLNAQWALLDMASVSWLVIIRSILVAPKADIMFNEPMRKFQTNQNARVTVKIKGCKPSRGKSLSESWHAIMKSRAK